MIDVFGMAVAAQLNSFEVKEVNGARQWACYLTENKSYTHDCREMGTNNRAQATLKGSKIEIFQDGQIFVLKLK